MFEHSYAERKQTSYSLGSKKKKRNWTWLCSRILWFCHLPSSTVFHWCQKAEDAEKGSTNCTFWCYVVFISYIKLITWVFWFRYFWFILNSSAKGGMRGNSHFKNASKFHLPFLVHKNGSEYFCYNKGLAFGVILRVISSTLLAYALNL